MARSVTTTRKKKASEPTMPVDARLSTREFGGAVTERYWGRL